MAKYVYMILEETDEWGVWTDPVDATRWYFRDELEENNGIIEYKGNKYTAQQITELMLEPYSDYPSLEKIEVDPQKNPWTN